jgi:hypothetical protein
MKWLRKHYKLFILILIPIVFSSIFYYNKRIGAQEIPTTDILDEINYVQAGYTLRKTGIPTAWSLLGTYKDLAEKHKTPPANFDDLMIEIKGKKPKLAKANKYKYPIVLVSQQDRGIGDEHLLFVQPFLDHPLLAGVIYSLGIKGSPDTLADLNPIEYRKIAITIATITGVLITLAAYAQTKKLIPSIIALFIYSTAPTFVLSSRFALLENVLIPFSLLFLIFIILFKDTQKDLYLYLSGLASGLAFLSKESGMFVSLAGIIYLIINKYNFKKILKFIIPCTLVSSSYFIYGLYLAPKLLFNIYTGQAGRGFFGPLNIISSIKGLHFDNFMLGGYFLFGIFSIFLLAKKFKQYQELLIVTSSYLFIFLFFGGANYAWYYLPFIPFLVIASGIQLGKLINKPNLKTLILFFILPFSSALYWGYYYFKETMNPNIYRLLLVAFSAAYFTYFCGEKIKKGEYQLNFLPNKLTKLIKSLAQKNIHYYLWILFIITIYIQTYRMNNHSIKYLITNWKELPEQFLLSPY